MSRPAAPRLRATAARAAGALALCLLLLGAATATGAQEAPQGPGPGRIFGQVFDAESGTPLSGVTVILQYPEGADGERQEIRVTDADGAFEYPSVPAGTYDLRFTKAGYRNSTMTDFTVDAGQTNRADFPLPPQAPETAEEILQLEEFVVTASTVEESLGIELRMESDQLLNILSAEDLSKFASSDVADALKRVSGVNIVEGQFAVVRGLEDRYNSTTYNGAPVPSPDPESQSVQLDLFPSDIVGDLVVSKTFAPSSPSNSSGGSIDIVTNRYPEELELKLKVGAGFEENALDRFLRFNRNAPTGEEEDPIDVVETDFGFSGGGRREFFDREFRFKIVGNREIDYSTAEGFVEPREPRRFSPEPGELPVAQSGGLAFGELELSGGRFDFTESERSTQLTGYLGFGFDMDADGNHRLDYSTFYTKKEEETVQFLEDGFFPNLARIDYEPVRRFDDSGQNLSRFFNNFATRDSWLAANVREQDDQSPAQGHLWWTNLSQSLSVLNERDLLVHQLNGEHSFPALDDLKATWAWNRAETSQSEEAIRGRIFFEPDDPDDEDPPNSFPSTVDRSLSGGFAISDDPIFSRNDITETQDFGRLDLEYETEVTEDFRLKLESGGWYENSERDTEATFLEFAAVDINTCFETDRCETSGFGNFAILGGTREEAGINITRSLERESDGNFANTRTATTDSQREIWAWYADLKATFWERLDVLGGLRIENIEITSLNGAPLTRVRFARPGFPEPPTDVFPTRYLFFDRLDNAITRLESGGAEPGTFNDELLGIDVEVDPDTGFVDVDSEQEQQELLNGVIDELKFLPAAGLSYRPLEGMTLRAAFSQTVARPSFREMAYFVTVPTGSSDLEVGNPQLKLSEVESFDGRFEYVWGEFGDLVAFSAFYKTIDDPIEKIVIRDPTNANDTSRAIFRTWFNNPNTADLWGVEVEARKNLGFLGWTFLEYFELGGNFTWIDARVERTEAERRRAEEYFQTLDGVSGDFDELEKERPLFGQPEWIANADITFDHPDWGTRLTLAFFAISDVLDAAGSATVAANGDIVSFTLDQYAESFHQLDLVFNQRLWKGLNFKASIKNLTDSPRGIVYDPEQTTDRVNERRYQDGRDYSFSLSYTHTF